MAIYMDADTFSRKFTSYRTSLSHNMRGIVFFLFLIIIECCHNFKYIDKLDLQRKSFNRGNRVKKSFITKRIKHKDCGSVEDETAYKKSDGLAGGNAKSGSAALGIGGSRAKGNSSSSSESQSFSKTRTKTKISTSSNAKSNSSVAAKVKTFANTRTETKVKTNEKTAEKKKESETTPSESSSTPSTPVTPLTTVSTVPPIITRPTHAYWSPSHERNNTVTPVTMTPISPTNSSSVGPISPCCPTYVCVNCPAPCPTYMPCPCPCPVQPPPSIVYCSAPCETPLPPPPPPPVYVLPQATYAMDGCPNCFDADCAMACKRDKMQPGNVHQTDFLTKTKYNVFQKAAVASDHHLCSTIGKNIFKKGGNSVDAAIATHFCVEVVNSHSTGLGGGGFLIAYDKKKGEAFTVDFRESLPSRYNKSGKVTQGTTILIPGVLKGLEEAHKRMGKLPWRLLFEPAIKLAREGFRVHEMLAMAVEKKEDFIYTNLGLRELFAPNGFKIKEGFLLKRKKLADTFEKIAESGGSDIFYRGEIADRIVADIGIIGGIITKDDMASYKAHIRPALVTEVAGMKFLGVKPPASSATVALMLKIMEKFNWSHKSLKVDPGLFYHQMIEAMKFAYAPSTFLGDPKYTPRVKEVLKYMMDPTVVSNMFKKIDNASHIVDYYGPYSNINITLEHGTSHMSAIGPDGDACAITSSINAYFGSKYVSRELGFIYNNEISDFSTYWPSIYNFTADVQNGGKRPMSKVAPIIMTNKYNGDVELVIGAAGGFFIPSAVASTMANFLFLKDNITTAVTRPRIHCQLFPPTIVYEDTMPKPFVPLMYKHLHKRVTNDTYEVSGQQHAIMGVIQAIAKRNDGSYEAVCDYRKGGIPDGF